MESYTMKSRGPWINLPSIYLVISCCCRTFSEETTSLIEASIEAKSFSYSPYSKFRVGCALKTSCGKIFKGCNVENVSFGLTICAERTALVKAVSEGYKSFEAIAVVSDTTDSFTYPCGACRQFIAEFGEVQIIVANNNKQYEATKISTILPCSFTNQDLDSGKNYE